MRANIVSLNSSSALLGCGVMPFALIFITRGDFFEGHLTEKIRKELALVFRHESFYCITDMRTVHFPCMVLVFFIALCWFRFEHVKSRLYFLVCVVSNIVREILILIAVLEYCSNRNLDMNNEVSG